MDDQQKAKEKKNNEIMGRVLADTIIKQLIDAGHETGELVNFASEIVRNITENGFVHDDQGGAVPRRARSMQSVRYRVLQIEEGEELICGDRVQLRRLHESDKSLLQMWVQEPEIARTFSKKLLDHLIEEFPQPTDPIQRFYVVLSEDDQEIGLVSLFNIDASVNQSETAKLLGDPQSRGKGYAREAAMLLMAYGFGELGLNRIYLRTAGFNLHNVRLNEKLGFHFEGILRESERLHEEITDVVLMSILRKEFDRLYHLEKET